MRVWDERVVGRARNCVLRMWRRANERLCRILVGIRCLPWSMGSHQRARQSQTHAPQLLHLKEGVQCVRCVRVCDASNKQSCVCSPFRVLPQHNLRSQVPARQRGPPKFVMREARHAIQLCGER